MSVTGGDYFQTGLQWNRNYDAMWFDGSTYVVAQPPRPMGDFTISCDVFPKRNLSNFNGFCGPNQTLSSTNRSGITIGYNTNTNYFAVFVSTSMSGGNYYCTIPTTIQYEWVHLDYTFSISTNTHTLSALGTVATRINIPIYWRSDNETGFVIGRWSTINGAYYSSGCIKNIEYYQNGILLSKWKGNGITNDNWLDLSGNDYHCTIYNNMERCLVHPRGAVIRGLDTTPYVVH